MGVFPKSTPRRLAGDPQNVPAPVVLEHYEDSRVWISQA